MEQFKRKEGGKKGKKKKRNTAQPLHGGCGCGAMRAASLLPVGLGGLCWRGEQRCAGDASRVRILRKERAKGRHPAEGKLGRPGSDVGRVCR